MFCFSLRNLLLCENVAPKRSERMSVPAKKAKALVALSLQTLYYGEKFSSLLDSADGGWGTKKMRMRRSVTSQQPTKQNQEQKPGTSRISQAKNQPVSAAVDRLLLWLHPVLASLVGRGGASRRLNRARPKRARSYTHR